MRIVLFIGVVLTFNASIFAQVEPANNFLQLKDSLMQRTDRLMNRPAAHSLIDMSDSMGSNYYIQTVLTPVDSLEFDFLSKNNTIAVEVYGKESLILPIGEQDRMIFTFKNNKKFTVKSLKKYHLGYRSTGDFYEHGYKILMKQLHMLAGKNVTAIQISEGNSYLTFNLKQSETDWLQKVANAFVQEYNNKVLKKQQ